MNPSAASIWREVLDGDVEAAITASLPPGGGTSASSLAQDRPVALIFEPCLASDRGHHLSFTRTHRDRFEGLGFRTLVFHAKANSLAREAGWFPYFLVPHHTMAHRKIESHGDLGRVHRYFTALFEHAVAIHRPSVCVLPTARFTNLAGLAAALADGGGSTRGRLIAGVMEATEPPDCDDPAVAREAFSRAGRLLDEAGIEHRIITETGAVRDALLEAGFRPDVLMVYPGLGAARSFPDCSIERAYGHPLRVGFVGDSRPVKNPEIILDLLLSDDRPDDVRFVLQLDMAYLARTRGARAEKVIRSLAGAGEVELHAPGLPEERFAELFLSLDVVLLPYSRRYDEIGSGIVVEAIRGATVPVLPEGSSMDLLYRSLGGRAPTLPEISVETLRTAIDECIERFPELAKRAREIRREWPSHPWSRESWERNLERWLVRTGPRTE